MLSTTPDSAPPLGRLLHRFDAAGGRLELIPTRPELLRAAAFIDGRSPIAAGPVETLRLAAATAREAPPPGPDRLLVHIGFCGSTLLARLLDVPGAVLALREPNVLADLANWRARLDDRGRDDCRFDGVLDLALASLRGRWEVTLVKPSNWANNLLPRLAARPGLRLVALVDTRAAFMTAVFRGGRERIAFAARSLVHLATAVPGFGAHIAAAAQGGESLDKAARFVALLHAVQLRLIAAANPLLVLSRADLNADLVHAVGAARVALDLPAGPTAAALEGHAKDPAQPWSADAEAAANTAVTARFGAAIAAGAAWADARLTA